VQNPQKFTQIWIFGLKTNHLATLMYIENVEIEFGKNTFNRKVHKNKRLSLEELSL
jgi:hypothetical protein